MVTFLVHVKAADKRPQATEHFNRYQAEPILASVFLGEGFRQVRKHP